MRLSILQRYVIWEVARSFTLALVTLTVIFVLFMVMSEASKLALAPSDILRMMPYSIPGSMPFTIPVSLLFAVTVVFGRIAGDNELIAVKTAGLSAMTMLWPAIVLGLVLSGTLLYLSNELIPRANHQAKVVIFKNFEDMFYNYLKRDREMDNPRWPYLIKVRDIEGKTMIDATFKHRAGNIDNLNSDSKFDMIVTAKKAVMRFDIKNSTSHVLLDGAEIQQFSSGSDSLIINKRELEIPIPSNTSNTFDKRVAEWTTREMTVEQAHIRYLMAQERRRTSHSTAFAIASGRFERLDWGSVQRTFIDFRWWQQKQCEYETEKQMRVAIGCSPFFFVLIGAPVGCLFARRDYLSAFICCFLPIIIFYYPLVMYGMNMGKEGIFNATLALWIGNILLGFIAGFFVLPPVIKR